MKEIALSSGKVAVIDDEDFERVSQFKWSYHALGYAFRGIGPRNARRFQYLHRFVLGAETPGGQRVVIDHINGDKLDNRKENLRLASRALNSINSARPYGHNKSSGIRGVHWSEGHQRWVASFTGPRGKHSKHFKSREAAAEYITQYRSKIHGALSGQSAPSPVPTLD